MQRSAFVRSARVARGAPLPERLGGRENLEKMRTHQNTTKAALPGRNLEPKSRTEVPIRNAVDLGELFSIFM